MGHPSMRRAEFLMVLAYATDLATGKSLEFASRSCVLAMRLADALGLGVRDRFDVYHQALLRYIGCNADTDLLAAAMGDEIELRRGLALVDLGNPAELSAFFASVLERLSQGSPPEAEPGASEQRVGEAILGSIPILVAHCEVAQRIGVRLGLPAGTCENLGQIYERWDGKGFPNARQGEAVGLAVRVVALCQDAMALTEAHGLERALDLIARRGIGAYGPGLVDAFLARSESLMRGIDGPFDRAAILALEPAPHARLDAEACEEAFTAIADMIDMRMPFTYGHSRAVASLAEAAGRRLALPAGDLRTLRWAALVHDLGELSVPVARWMTAGPLPERIRDEARLHPYWAERALGVLGEEGRPVGPLVLRHHERLDGSGYHRGARSPDLSPASRVLAAAEAFQTAREARPHRPALTDAAAAARLRADAGGGRLCPQAVEAVLEAAGQRSRRAGTPALGGLTPRELEVLRLIATGLTAKEVATRLDIATKTADNHIQSLYLKIGVSTRAAAALHAVERGLLQPETSLA